MSQSTKKLMKFLAGTRGEGYSRSRAARACCMSERSVDRAISELKKCRAIEVQKGGYPEPSKITVLMTMDGFLSRQSKMARHCRVTVASLGPVLNNARASETQTQKKEKQHQRVDVESSLSEEIRKAAGFEALSGKDRLYLATLAASGIPAEAIRAGVLVGRARNHGRQKIRSLRYFANVISDAARGAFPDGYVEYVEHRLEHYEKQQPFEHERASFSSTGQAAGSVSSGAVIYPSGSRGHREDCHVGEPCSVLEIERKPPGAELELREMAMGDFR